MLDLRKQIVVHKDGSTSKKDEEAEAAAVNTKQVEIPLSDNVEEEAV
jgi:hypothetical protein